MRHSRTTFVSVVVATALTLLGVTPVQAAPDRTGHQPREAMGCASGRIGPVLRCLYVAWLRFGAPGEGAVDVDGDSGPVAVSGLGCGPGVVV